jgi:hypothetical protein
LTRTNAGLRLAPEGGEGAIVFDAIEPGFTYARSDQPFTQWDSKNEGWLSVLDTALPAPGVERLHMPLVEKKGIDSYIHYDIFGLTYWMLARIEEIGRNDLDSYGRFPATSSHAFQHGYLNRPVVDEWFYLLQQVIERQWPGIVLRRHRFQMQVSHDVDRPSLYAFKTWGVIGRMMAGHLLKRLNPKAFLAAPYIRIATRKQLMDTDPYNTFDWLMDVSEDAGLQSAFYFVCGKTCPKMDPEYAIEHPAICSLLRKIHQRGHEIGLHPSYQSYKNPEVIKKELTKLKNICAREGIIQENYGGRTHYLRWTNPITLRALNDAGLSYDSSLGYADRPGFRCGTCFEYPGFDAERSEILNLRIRPLIAMETTMLASQYMGLGTRASALEKFEQLKRACQALEGCFRLLWHNCQLEKQEERELYRRVLSTYEGSNPESAPGQVSEARCALKT